MKKPMFTAILIALVLLVVSTAYAQSVTDIDLGTLIREVDNNSARALQLYGNKTIRTSGRIYQISSDYIRIGVSEYNFVWVYPATSERSKIINLNNGQTVTVRGVFSTFGSTGTISNAVIEANSPQAAAPSARQQPQTTAHYRFANSFDMGQGRNVTPFFTTTWPRVWDLYNTNKQPAIDIQTFFDTLLKELDSSGRYLSNKDINLSVYQLDLEDNDTKRLTDFMDLNGQNVALMSMTDVPTAEYRMIFKTDRVWQILFFYKTLDMSKF